VKPNTRWLPFFGTSFLGVFNANYLKLLIITIAVNWMPPDPGNHSFIVSLASGLFFVSYIFFSPLAGRLSMTLYKKKIIIWIRIIQFPIYILACTGFWLHNLYIVFICIFLIGFTSTLYGPAKYSLIRDIGGVKGISFGTGTLEMLTFLGNILSLPTTITSGCCQAY
jgi:MFS family permease